MMFLVFRLIGIQVVFFILYLEVCLGVLECNRLPVDTNTEALPADSRFVLDIEDCSFKYIPGNNYTIRLYSVDKRTPFIAFTIAIKGDTKDNAENPRRRRPLTPGRLIRSQDSTKNDTTTRENCANTLFQIDKTPKTAVEALWLTPPKGNKCVTVYAYVAIQPDVWYNAEGPLKKQVCEDRRKDEDMPPKLNDNCHVCEEARYELIFQGTWSFNTHPQMFPTISPELARFSDIVGASHSKDFYVYKYNSDAQEGLKVLAEQGNTTVLELEILNQLGRNVRTIIKATAPPKPNMTTVTSFRANSKQHLVSIVAALQPSPDWFLGVANMELCDANTGEWAKNRRLNLYPLDAGTDSGLTFEDANEATSPPKPITDAVIKKSITREEYKPFAKIKINLIRTYSSNDCTQDENVSVTDRSDGGEVNGGEEPSVPYIPPPQVTSEEPLPTDLTVRDCSLTTWEEWLPCEGECENNVRDGYQTRFRYYIVDGETIGKYFDNDAEEEKEVPGECLKYSPNDYRPCHESCENPTEAPEEPEEAQRRISSDSILPGQNWHTRK